MTILSIVGARPEFVQAMPVSRALRIRHREILVHTGQHYDHAMSEQFFVDLPIPRPEVTLDVGSGPHGRQTAAMLSRLEDVMLAERPDAVLVRGDTNSTLAGGLAAAKLGIPVVHVEAGERSFQATQPEEINRVVVDHLSALHFCASRAAVARLAAEGITQSVHWVGDVMLDALQIATPLARDRAGIIGRLGLHPQHYAVVTVHRAHNTDDPARLRAIVDAINAREERVVFPVHPRTRQLLAGLGTQWAPHVTTLEPLPYLDLLALTQQARLVATDSGGLQREAYYLGVPCLTLRDETEWVETVETGWNRLVGADPRRIAAEWGMVAPAGGRPPIYGEGRAADAIVRGLDRFLGSGGVRG